MIRVFVGCAPNGEDIESQAVLEYTLRKNASQPVEIVWMQLSKDPDSFWFSDGEKGWRTERWATPFSGFRWGIPAYCGFQGKAIYTDSDVIFMGDIAQLWEQKVPYDKVVLGKGNWRLCVSLWDCQKAAGVLDPIERLRSDPNSHKRMNEKVKPFIAPFDGHWNVLDGEGFADLRNPHIGAIHYTDMSCQPQLRHAIPRLVANSQRHWFDGAVRRHPRRDLEELFDTLLEEAEVAGYGRERYLPPQPFGGFNKATLTHYRGRAA